jgi:hypothetical protein
MNPQHSNQRKPVTVVSRVLNLLGLTKPDEHEIENVNPVDEVRAGLKDIKAGRVREIKRASDLIRK